MSGGARKPASKFPHLQKQMQKNKQAQSSRMLKRLEVKPLKSDSRRKTG